jgi:hypothetical protein
LRFVSIGSLEESQSIVWWHDGITDNGMILRDYFLSSSSHNEVHLNSTTESDIVENDLLFIGIINYLKSLGCSANKVDTKIVFVSCLAEEEWMDMGTTETPLSIICLKPFLSRVRE